MYSLPIKTVWIDPPKYWAATAGMTDDDKTRLLNRIEQLAARGDSESLQKINFVSLEMRGSHRRPATPARKGADQEAMGH
jgi:hypothetical protein